MIDEIDKIKHVALNIEGKSKPISRVDGKKVVAISCVFENCSNFESEDVDYYGCWFVNCSEIPYSSYNCYEH